MKTAISLTLAGLALASGAALAQQGVSKSEITLGSIQDLSGPIAGFGKQVRLGMMLRVDEINEQGGVNGRKLNAHGGRLGLRPQDAPCWPRRSWSTRTRSSRWWPTSAPRKTWQPCRCSSTRT